MYKEIEHAVCNIADGMLISTAAEMAQKAQAIKTLTEAAVTVLNLEDAPFRDPFFTEAEARSIAEAMVSLDACPHAMTCEGEPDEPCNLCWLKYLMEART